MWNKEDLRKVRTIAIYGSIGSGKTALAYHLIELFGKERPVYFYNYPKPELLEKLGYQNLTSLEQMEKIYNSILYIDEPQLHFGVYDKKSNEVIAKICSLARQLDITLIISSSDTRVFTRSNEAYFDLWLIKNLDYDFVKQGSKIKKIIKRNTKFSPNGFMIDVNEFVADCRIVPNFNGKFSFSKPDYFTDAHSKPYLSIGSRLQEITIPKESAKETAKESVEINEIANSEIIIQEKK